MKYFGFKKNAHNPYGIFTITIIGLLLTFTLNNCAKAQFMDKLKKEAGKITDTKKIGDPFSADEAAKALKEALVQGTSKGTDFVSKMDGFYKNPEITIPFPPQAEKVKKTLTDMGMKKQVDEVVLSLNRAAEDAAKSAKDIFVGAIQKMTINDAINIVKGDSTAATSYLQKTTSSQLTQSFSPIIQNSLDKVNATKYWTDVMNIYNKVPFVEKVNPDLKQYVTDKAMYALFLMISKEEKLIRKDPIARTTELLKKVFGK